MNHAQTDDLPLLTDAVDGDNDTLPVLTEAIEDIPPPAATPAATFDPLDGESALQAHLEQLLTEKLTARLAAAQQAILAELKAELPELIRRARIPPRS